MNGSDLSGAVGLMADSHGRPETISAALERLAQWHCRAMFHLGDICDSASPGSAEACVDRLVAAQVLAVRGNNDHSLLVGAAQGRLIPERIRRFLANLPLRRLVEGAVLAHSLPFEREMGLSCMMAPLEGPALGRVARAFPGRIFFRGHSHQPEAICRNGDHWSTVPLAPGESIDLDARRVLAVTCGALTRGLCMVWWPQKATLTCLAI